jgi:hypothetical protein
MVLCVCVCHVHYLAKGPKRQHMHRGFKVPRLLFATTMMLVNLGNLFLTWELATLFVPTSFVRVPNSREIKAC